MYPFKIVTDYTWGSTGDMTCIVISLLVSELVQLISMFVPYYLTFSTCVLYYMKCLRSRLGTQVTTTVD
jgi:hypothetical protein